MNQGSTSEDETKQIKEMILDGQYNAGIDKTLLSHISNKVRFI